MTGSNLEQIWTIGVIIDDDDVIIDFKPILLKSLTAMGKELLYYIGDPADKDDRHFQIRTENFETEASAIEYGIELMKNQYDILYSKCGDIYHAYAKHEEWLRQWKKDTAISLSS